MTTDTIKKADLAKAMSNVARLEVLEWALEQEGPFSPKMVAAGIERPIENVAYHVKVLRHARLFKPARQGEVRGAVEHFYVVTPLARRADDALRELAVGSSRSTGSMRGDDDGDGSGQAGDRGVGGSDPRHAGGEVHAPVGGD